jgi:hypothetical protein
MHPSTNISEQALDAAGANSPVADSSFWAKLKAAAERTVFWAYKRGSPQYDVIVIAILAFIFFSPRSWFNDRPTLQLADLRHQQGVIEVSHVNKSVSFLIDARLVDSVGPKPEDAIPIILKRRIAKPFTLKSIDAVRDRQQVILGYTVMVEE